MKIISIIITLTIISSIGSVLYLISSESESNNFKNYELAVESGLIDRGWIPSFIPKSSYNIKEQHKVDVSNIFVELHFEPQDISYFEKECELISVNEYKCENLGYPVKVTITNKSHAIIKSI